MSQLDAETGWGTTEWECPAMPVTNSWDGYQHRRKDGHTLRGRRLPIEACVAQQLEKKEWSNNPEAMAALWKEFHALVKAEVWDIGSVTSRFDLLAKKRKHGNDKINIAKIFPIVVLKGSELPVGDLMRKYKGRIVFMGNDVVDQYGDVALFQDMASSPATLEASKVVDCHGCLKGHVCQQADAQQAYIQAVLDGDETWIMIPEEMWLDEWKASGLYTKANPPCCHLKKALYGHPKSGKYWEEHAEERIFACGFKLVNQWKSPYYYEKEDVMLMVYVDDFKMSVNQRLLRGVGLISDKKDLRV